MRLSGFYDLYRPSQKAERKTISAFLIVILDQGIRYDCLERYGKRSWLTSSRWFERTLDGHPST